MAKISIVTPCVNAERYIEQTVRSVVGQSAFTTGRATLEYLVCDGASRDRTVEIAKNIGGSHVTVLSEPDRGMYDALAKGLRCASGDIVAYINAGDYYHPGAFDVVLDVFEQRHVEWLTGYRVEYNERSQIVRVELPYRYRRSLFACGAYNDRQLPFVQQESTFWSARLHRTIPFDQLATFKLAGDFFLWHQFARQCDLTIVRAYLGGFRVHSGQLSGNINAYRAEMEKLASKPRLRDRLTWPVDRLVWSAPDLVKRWLNPGRLLFFNHRRNLWE